MSHSYEKDFSDVEKRYTSQELLKGFARFSNSNVLATNELTRNWLWHSLTLCQHFFNQEKTLSKDKIRQILLLTVVSPSYKNNSSFEWLKINQEKHPEIKDLVESLIVFLEHNSSESSSQKNGKNSDYLFFILNTLYFAASGVVSCLFLPNVFIAVIVFIFLSSVYLMHYNYNNNKKNKNFKHSIKSKMIEIDNMTPSNQSAKILDLISGINVAPFLVDKKVEESFEKLILSTKRFVKLYQKNESDLNTFFNVESIWKNTIPSLASYDYTDKEACSYALSVMEKMEYMIRNYIQDLMRVEINGLKVEEAYWSAKIASEE